MEKRKIIALYFIFFLLMITLSYQLAKYGIDIHGMYIFSSIVILHVTYWVLKISNYWIKYAIAVFSLYLIIANGILEFYGTIQTLQLITRYGIIAFIIYFIYSSIRNRLDKSKAREQDEILKKL